MLEKNSQAKSHVIPKVGEVEKRVEARTQETGRK